MVVLRKLFPSFLALLLAAAFFAPATAQNSVSGDITGIVSDQTGAVLPNISVTMKSNDNGSTQTTTTNASGIYRFSLLAPGSYNISATSQGFQGVQRSTTVVVGQASTVNLQMGVSSSNTTVEVVAGSDTVQTQNGNISTTFSPVLVSQVPNPGNDLSYILQTAPGAVMNTQSGYGNSSTFGLPATSNLFTINGENENDPFFNVNNSGATNLLLGQNDVSEVTVVNNGYSGQYGQLGGANVNYVTKSGSNKYHGNAIYYWNGRALNANNFFNNRSDTPRPFDNANQWAASFGGPIKKDKTFFFIDTEGLRLVIPTSTPTNIPSPQFQAATLANLATSSPASIPFYQSLFSLYNNAPGANRAANALPGGTTSGGAATGPGCVGFTPFADATTPCALQFFSNAGNFTHEWLLSGRVDQNIGNNDRAFIHFRTDHGVQSTFTDPISPLFNAVSTQPQYEGQLNETHTFSATAVNQFILSGSWYSAIFGPPNLGASLAALPYSISFAGTAFTTLGGLNSVFPQGRNATQYQIVDDFSWIKGNHNLKFGANFRRNDITDYDPQDGSIGFSANNSLANFFAGNGTSYIQNFPSRLTQPISLYGLDFYAQDEWAVRPNLKLTVSLRAEHNSNPVCQTNCFARLSNSFLDDSHDVNLPYNQSIVTGLNQALINYTKVDWQPRFGFAWSPLGPSRSTVIRGGFGLFADIFPGVVADNFIKNAPLNNQFSTGVAPLSPGVAGNQSALVAAANTAFTNGFASGGTLASISASLPPGVPFVPPNLFNVANTVHNPRYQEWNLQFEQGIGQKMTFSLNYVGNHGLYEPVQNAGLNGYCNSTCLSALNPASPAANFNGLPASPIDPRFGVITEVQSAGVSNYNGLSVSLTRKFSQVQLQANYTWSHALDDISNGGFLPFGALPITNVSPINPQNPFNIGANYGNADYDTRHYFSLSYVWDTPKFHGLLGTLANWTVSGTIFARSGLPFTAYDSGATGILNGFNYGTTSPGGFSVFANYPSGTPVSCDRGAVNSPCLSASNFSPATAGFGDQRRNQLYGPNFFDTDLTVMKNFHVPISESSTIGIGFQFFNLFNHANFDQPVGDVASSQFGLINRTVSVPTSILGSFLNGDASPRLIQVKAQFTF
jgi:hypothetical protein